MLNPYEFGVHDQAQLGDPVLVLGQPTPEPPKLAAEADVIELGQRSLQFMISAINRMEALEARVTQLEAQTLTARWQRLRARLSVWWKRLIHAD